jgi:hypothetical protein
MIFAKMSSRGESIAQPITRETLFWFYISFKSVTEEIILKVQQAMFAILVLGKLGDSWYHHYSSFFNQYLATKMTSQKLANMRSKPGLHCCI